MEQKMKMGVIESRKIKRIRTEKYDRKGSATVEAAFLLPLLLALFMLLTETAIFFYNRAAAVDLAGQAVIHGAQMEHAGRRETEDKILKEMQKMRYRDFFHAVCRILTEKRDFPMQSVGAVWRHLQKDRL